MAYNVDLLEKAGITSPPTNWDELTTAAITASRARVSMPALPVALA